MTRESGKSNTITNPLFIRISHHFIYQKPLTRSNESHRCIHCHCQSRYTSSKSVLPALEGQALHTFAHLNLFEALLATNPSNQLRASIVLFRRLFLHVFKASAHPMWFLQPPDQPLPSLSFPTTFLKSLGAKHPCLEEQEHFPT